MPYQDHTVRRVTTTHTPEDQDGQHVTAHDQLLPLPSFLNGSANRTPIFTHRVDPTVSKHTITPSEIDAANSLTSHVTLEKGVTSCVMDMTPGAKIGIHRTDSLDHGTILHGSVWMTMPDGPDGKETRTLIKAGDTFVQRGTAHGWEAGEEGVRFFVVMVHAEPVKVPGTGKELKEYW